MRDLTVPRVVFVCPHCGFLFNKVPKVNSCRWCHGHFGFKARPLPVAKEVTC